MKATCTKKSVGALLAPRRPGVGVVLCTESHARSMLPGADEDEVKRLWEEGRVLVWNIGLGWNIVPRIWPASLQAYVADPCAQCPTAESVISQILPSERAYLTSTEVRLLLNCGATHVTNLIVEKQLQLVPGTHYHRGPHGAAQITAASLRNFFLSRCLNRAGRGSKARLGLSK